MIAWWNTTSGHARAFLAAFLHGCPAADDSVLLASELAANASVHSASGRPGGTFTLRARVYRSGRVHAEIEDRGSAWDGDVSSAEPPHGLFLLRQLSADCGARPGRRGWIVWSTIGAPRAGRARQP
ncbi:MAG TPA: ATP-binding protein [Streptosporangiaceae bacterium]|nr:ATP-binding protein [Streptosporangiaceae bacterium]